MAGVMESLFGGDKDWHENNSVTERFSDGTSITCEADGTVREYTTHESTIPGVDKLTVTRNGDGEIVNVQDGWGPTAG